LFVFQTEILINLNFLTNRNLKRKIDCLITTNCFMNVFNTTKNIIANYLIKKSKIDFNIVVDRFDNNIDRKFQKQNIYFADNI